MKKQLISSIALLGFAVALIASPVYAKGGGAAEPVHVDVAAPAPAAGAPAVAAPVNPAAPAKKVKGPDAAPAEPVHVDAVAPAAK